MQLFQIQNGQFVPIAQGGFFDSITILNAGAVLLVIAVLIIAWALVGYPKWRVWAAHQSGLADLMQAKNEQQIQIAQAQSRLGAAEMNKEAAIIEEMAEAQARLSAADLNKQAAVIEAKAVALQIEEIGKQLTAHDLYLRWQWIKMMEERNSDADTIYVPTEANLPLLEASRKSQ